MNNSDQLPERSHNNPPELLPMLPPEATDEEVNNSLFAAKGDVKSFAYYYDIEEWAALHANTLLFCDAASEWIDIETITTLDQSERLTDFVAGARALFKRVNDSRKGAKKPWDERAAQVQAAYAPLTEKLNSVAVKMKDMQADWLMREDARIKDEQVKAAREAAEKKAEADRLAAEAAASNDISGQIDAEAAQKEAVKAQKAAARPTRARAGSSTGAGRTMALRTKKSAKITNLRACFSYFQDDPVVIAALTQCADAAVRGGITDDDAKMAGFDIITTQGAA